MPHYDAIVLGLGGVGSAALFHLARRGHRVLGLDRFPAGHDRGSSHGETRIIRQAYFEHPDYVPLLRRSYELWHELETISGEALFHQVGLLQVGPADGVVVDGVLRAAALHGLPIETLSAADTERRFPGVAVPPGSVGVVERNAGYLLVERCVLAHLAAARQAGAQARHDCDVQGWEATAGGIAVNTADDRFTADRLVVAAGSWSSDLLAGLAVPLRVLRKHLHWFSGTAPEYHHAAGFPTFLFELPQGIFYGFPQINAAGLKVAEHSGGTLITDPLTDPRQPDPVDDARVRQFLNACLPGVGSQRARHAVCFYTLSPDEHFLIDRHPASDRVVFAAGLSGHGFKFASVLGEILADLALTGGSALPIDFLSLRRFPACS
jgi:sarcosine oxidase